MSVRPIDALNKMAKSFGVAKQDLLVLAPANDPFNSGTETNVVMAEWFARLLDEHNLPPGKHLRRYHYLLSTLDGLVNMPDGKPYENTESCWRADVRVRRFPATSHVGEIPTGGLRTKKQRARPRRQARPGSR